MPTLTPDKVHRSFDFPTKHMMVSKAKGEFTDFDGDFNGDLNDLTAANIKVTISVKSIDTGNEDRDGHLRSDDFFEADQYPN
ncbi:YceI family protein, partial [Staphylococcus sp. SIMBA_130]